MMSPLLLFDRFFGENWRLEWPTQKGFSRIGTAIGGSQLQVWWRTVRVHT